MLYSEFLIGTGAVDNEATYAEYKRVEEIYMAAATMTKEDAYRMAQVETIKQQATRQKKARKDEMKWVSENLQGAAAYIKAMADKLHQWKDGGQYFRSECGNEFELRFVRSVGSMILYEMFANGKPVNPDPENYDRALLDSAEIQSYRADWHDKTLAELEDLFGYIA